MAPETRPENPPPADPCKKDPAPQPKPPTTPCEPIPIGLDPPCYTEPPPCKTCCECPGAPSDQPSCLEDLIKKEADAINKGEQAKKFKTELEALLGKVKTATIEYTADSYKDLVERWRKEDDAIVCLVRSIQCALPCWWCVIECELCPLINDIVRRESKLSGLFKTCDPKPAPPTTPPNTPPATPPAEPCLTSLYDLRHWWWREKLRRTALFDHIAGVMRAWETPFKTIDATLKANAEILKTSAAALGIDQKQDAAKLLFDVFFRLIPQHMAIAPVADKPENTTKIEKKYVELCCCDNSDPLHECCGVVIRWPTVRDRIIGPLPYLIAPDKYSDLICCLSTNVYQPAKQKAVEADSKYAELDTEVKAIEASIGAQLKSLPVDAKQRLGKTIDCTKDYKSKSGTGGGKTKCCEETDPPPCEPPPCEPPPCDPPQDGGNKPPADPAQTTTRA